MKTIKTSNFKNAQKMLMGDNTCPDCGALIMGTARPCGSCGWKKDWLRPDSLEQLLSTKSAKRVLLMTGTPILNSPVDLFSLLHLLDPVTFPSMVRFKKTYLLMNHHSGRHEFKRNGLDDLKPYIEDRYLARTKDDVGLKLPTRRIHVERVDLDPAEYPLQARTIEQVTKTAQIILSSGQTMTLFDILTILLRKRQAGVWPGGIEMKDLDGNVIFSVGSEVRESVKFDRALERVQEYHALGRRQVVFSQFRTVLVEFEDRLTKAGLRVARMDGSTPEGKRNEIRTNFYRAKGEEPKWDIVLCHYKTGGAGLNLTSATVTHILDEEWNAGKRDQAYGRSHRLGQTEETDIHVYRIPGTVDTFMANLISLKEKLANDFKQTMTNDELMSRLTEAIRRGEA
jgi:SNF2 family DNA or RNA helicase